MAAILEGFSPVLIEQSEEYAEIIRARLAWAERERDRRIPALFSEGA
jgi:hypothetical protein